jgi:electron transfer flavoprotein alpha subunit
MSIRSGERFLMGSALRIAVLVKQVPRGDYLELGDDGRLIRSGPAEINPFCRRAIATGVRLASESGGRCDLITMGPPGAVDILKEGLAWGAHAAVLLCDTSLVGADSLVTASALVAVIRLRGPYDVILAGRNSVDADTGQVAPQVAQLLDLPLVNAARELTIRDGIVSAVCEYDDASISMSVAVPVVASCAERICEPAKVDRADWVSGFDDRIDRLSTKDLASVGWTPFDSPTVVTAVASEPETRAGRLLRGTPREQALAVASHLAEAATLAPTPSTAVRVVPGPAPSSTGGVRPIVAIICEPGRSLSTAELLGAAAALALEIGGAAVALDLVATDQVDLASLGADEVVRIVGAAQPQEVAATIADWAAGQVPWAILVPSTLWGREVAGRVAAQIGAGLVGDAIALEVSDGRLVAWKPAFGGRLIASIASTTPTQMATVRPGALPAWLRRDAGPVATTSIDRRTASRVTVTDVLPSDDAEALATARAVVGVGAGVAPDEYELLGSLTEALGAELAATRKVTDRGWLPHARQVGLTGRSIAPDVYVAIGLSGKYNHMVGVRRAGTVIAINSDPEAPVAGFADLTMVADWREAVPALAEALRTVDRRGPSTER